MKEFIVIFATVILGIVLAGFVLGLGDKAEDLNDKIDSNFDTISSTADTLLSTATGSGGSGN